MSANGTNPNLPSRLRSGRLPGDNRTFSNPGSTLQHPGNSPNSLGAAVVSSHRASDRRARRVPAATFTARLEKYRCRDRPRAVSLYPGRCRRLFRGTAGAAGRVRQWTGGQRDAAPAWMNSGAVPSPLDFQSGPRVRRTLRWRETDSNLRFLARKSRFLLRKANYGDRTGAAKKGCFLYGTDGSKSISLQRGVRCEPRCFGISKRTPSSAVGNPKLHRQLGQGLLLRKRRHRHSRLKFRAVLFPLDAHLSRPFGPVSL